VPAKANQPNFKLLCILTVDFEQSLLNTVHVYDIRIIAGRGGCRIDCRVRPIHAFIDQYLVVARCMPMRVEMEFDRCAFVSVRK